MSGALRTVSKVAGAVASVAAFIPGGQGIAAIAATVAIVASVGAELTYRPPPKRGSVSQTTIGTDQPTPYLIGRTYYGGSRIHQTGYGPTLKKVPNPYLLTVDVYSGAGPLDALEGVYADFAPIGFAGDAATDYFGGFLWRSTQLGQAPEGTALAPHWAGAPGWTAASRLSSYAAIAWSALFDRDGKVFSSGLPQLGAVWRGVRVYDPRQDSTYPGGAGPQRIDDRTTWTWSENPGCHALTYVIGHFIAGSKRFGVGIPADGIRIGDFVTLANVCDANGWTVGGVIFEPGSKWQNLKDICAAGAAQPCFVGGKLGVTVSAPRVAIDRIDEADLADGEVSVGAMRGWEDRLNTLIPKYRSEPHRWEYVQADEIAVADFIAQDGERKVEERQFNLVQDPDQAAQLCAYELYDRREKGEIVLTCKPRLRRYGSGDLLTVHLPEAGLVEQPCVVLKRTLDASTMTVTLVLRGETMAKHAAALAAAGTAATVPVGETTEQADQVAAAISYSDEAGFSLSLGGGGSNNTYDAAKLDQLQERVRQLEQQP